MNAKERAAFAGIGRRLDGFRTHRALDSASTSGRESGKPWLTPFLQIYLTHRQWYRVWSGQSTSNMSLNSSVCNAILRCEHWCIYSTAESSEEQRGDARPKGWQSSGEQRMGDDAEQPRLGLCFSARCHVLWNSPPTSSLSLSLKYSELEIRSLIWTNEDNICSSVL